MQLNNKIYIRASLVLTIVTLLIFGVVYPFLVVGLGGLFAPEKAEGSPMYQNGRLVGFENVGQPFKSQKYFWGRPSAVNYNAAGTGGSNAAASNPDYRATVKARRDTFLKYHPYVKQVPVELVTASGSGLDPHISVRAAEAQITRVAKARGISPETVKKLVQTHTLGPYLGFLGPRYVHVLKLNLALDAASPVAVIE